MRSDAFGQGLMTGIIVALVVLVLIVMIFTPAGHAIRQRQNCELLNQYADEGYNFRLFVGVGGNSSKCQLEVQPNLWVPLDSLVYGE